jgi:hypothetical protein
MIQLCRPGERGSAPNHSADGGITVVWRALDDYPQFARALVSYMWRQDPPLSPRQFADRMAVHKRTLSDWLNHGTVPSPVVVTRLARGMHMPVHDLMTAAGYGSADDPLLDLDGAQSYVIGMLERMLERMLEVAMSTTHPSANSDASPPAP